MTETDKASETVQPGGGQDNGFEIKAFGGT